MDYFFQLLIYLLYLTASDAPEAEVDEVLDSLRSRIRSMFKWAKSEVSMK